MNLQRLFAYFRAHTNYPADVCYSLAKAELWLILTTGTATTPEVMQ